MATISTTEAVTAASVTAAPAFARTKATKAAPKAATKVKTAPPAKTPAPKRQRLGFSSSGNKKKSESEPESESESEEEEEEKEKEAGEPENIADENKNGNEGEGEGDIEVEMTTSVDPLPNQSALQAAQPAQQQQRQQQQAIVEEENGLLGQWEIPVPVRTTVSVEEPPASDFVPRRSSRPRVAPCRYGASTAPHAPAATGATRGRGGKSKQRGPASAQATTSTSAVAPARTDFRAGQVNMTAQRPVSGSGTVSQPVSRLGSGLTVAGRQRVAPATLNNAKVSGPRTYEEAFVTHAQRERERGSHSGRALEAPERGVPQRLRFVAENGMPSDGAGEGTETDSRPSAAGRQREIYSPTTNNAVATLVSMRRQRWLEQQQQQQQQRQYQNGQQVPAVNGYHPPQSQAQHPQSQRPSSRPEPYYVEPQASRPNAHHPYHPYAYNNQPNGLQAQSSGTRLPSPPRPRGPRSILPRPPQDHGRAPSIDDRQQQRGPGPLSGQLRTYYEDAYSRGRNDAQVEATDQCESAYNGMLSHRQQQQPYYPPSSPPRLEPQPYYPQQPHTQQPHTQQPHTQQPHTQQPHIQQS
ncbi:hypothetical protein BGZ54_004379, partial [Gamsiella multidivaricata]